MQEIIESNLSLKLGLQK